MNAPAGPVVVIGTGHAGFHLAQSLRANGFDGSIVLIGEELGLPYERPPLSKAYLKGGAEDSVHFRPAAFYQTHHIDVRVGTAVRIDREMRLVIMADGDPVHYGHLVLATGGAARRLAVPGADLSGVVALRTLSDATLLREKLVAANNVVVVGGGFIGLEATSAALAAGATVRVLEAAPRLMGRAVSQPVSEYLLRRHRSAGVTVSLDAKVTALTGQDGVVTGVRSGDDTHLDADLVLVGVGSVPRTELAVDAGLVVADGIVVDAELTTSDPFISAIGDCVRFPVADPSGSTTPRSVRLESVQNAVDQARCVAGKLSGHPEAYSAVPWFWSEQGGVKLQMAGLPGSHDTEVLRPGPNADRFSIMLFAGNRLVGAESVNAPGDHMAVRKLLTAGRTVEPAQMADPAVDLRALVS